jgi:hypothetical protein
MNAKRATNAIAVLWKVGGNRAADTIGAAVGHTA